MLENKIVIFENACKSLEFAVNSNDNAAVTEQDKILSSVWLELIEFEPNNKAECLILAKFLLKQIGVSFGEGQTLDRIRDRCIELISELEEN